MYRRFLIVLTCIVLTFSQFSNFSFASDSTIKKNSVISFFSSVKNDVLHVASSPFHMSRDDAIQVASFAVFNSILIYGFDSSADEEFGIEGDDVYLKPAKGLVKLGEVYDGIGSQNVLIGLSASMLTGGIIFKDKKLLHTTRLMVESAVIAGGITYLSKGLLGRSRPYTNVGSNDFHPLKFSKQKEYRAFPSGHSTSAFSMMTVIAKQYDQWWIQIPAYTLAVSVALQRIESRNHWASDVVVGGAIGYWVGTTLVNHHKRKTQSVSFRPYLAGNRVGVTIGF